MCGISRDAQPLLLEDDTWSSRTYYAFPVRTDVGAHKDEEMKELRNIISLYEEVINGQENRLRKLQASKYFSFCK
jgi:hypothetical protein